MAKLLISNLGYPRIGFSRQWKKCLESFWSGSLGQEQFLTEMKNLRLAILQNQKDLGVDLIPVNDFTFYDQVLDMATMFNIVPKRYKHDPSGPVDLSTYFAMARGEFQLDKFSLQQSNLIQFLFMLIFVYLH